METERIIDLVKHAPLLKALLEEDAMGRQELEQHLDVSKSTVHRFTRTLRENGLIERVSGQFVLTPLGRVNAEEIDAFETTIETAWNLAPLIQTASRQGIDIDVAAFSDATVTTAAPGNPYRPVNRFMSIIKETDTLLGLDPSSVNPLHLDEIHDRIVNGMETKAVFPPDVIEELLLSNPERARSAFESGNLTLRTHNDLPFGLTLCDNRIGVGMYDDNTGLLQTYVDTTAPAALEWAEDVYEHYWDEATTLSEHAEISGLLLNQEPGNDDK